MRTVLSDKPDPAAMSFVRLAANPVYNAQLRTTCVATMLQAATRSMRCRNWRPPRSIAGSCPVNPSTEVKATWSACSRTIRSPSPNSISRC